MCSSGRHEWSSLEEHTLRGLSTLWPCARLAARGPDFTCRSSTPLCSLSPLLRPTLTRILVLLDSVLFVSCSWSPDETETHQGNVARKGQTIMYDPALLPCLFQCKTYPF